MLATITGFGVGLFLHVLAVVVAFGPTLAYPIFSSVAQKTDPRSVPTVIRAILRVDRILVNPAMVVLLLAGIYLLAKEDISAGEIWVTEGLTAIIVLFGMLHGFFMPKGREVLEVAERDLKDGDELSPEFETLAKQLEAGGKIATLIVVVTIFFMVVRP